MPAGGQCPTKARTSQTHAHGAALRGNGTIVGSSPSWPSQPLFAQLRRGALS